MGEKIIVGPFKKGLRNDVTPFNIDNESFPVLINAYQWRGRIKRKRGTSFLGRLQRNIGTTNGAGSLTVTILPAPIASGISSFIIGTDVFVDPGGANPVTLLTNSLGTAVLDRTTGILTITGSIALTAVIFFPSLPVMGLEDFVLSSNPFPQTVAFDTKYSYGISTTFPYAINDVSFYKNPPTGGLNLPGYTQKAPDTPITWNSQDYQQFWTVNYQGALWATNGINIPFSVSNIGMQFASPTTTPALTAAVRLSATTMSFTIVGNPLVVGDFVFVNEFISSVPANATTLNFQSGYVTTSGNTFIVTFPFAAIAADTYTAGMVQYLTNRSDVTVDTLRWYDGDPTTSNNGWVNFAPPLSKLSYSIADLPQAQYYLVGARMIFPFKDRLLFIGPVVQTSNPGSQVYLQDTVIYSQNGTPYYTASFTGDPSLVTTVFHEILVPINQTATANAYWEDQTGFGGFITAGIDQPITTSSMIGDVLILGFTNIQTKLVYSGSDVVPFNFFIINSELGSSSTFSSINLDKGVMTRGDRGFVITSQVGAERFDLEIPDEVFQISLLANGTERVTAQRDFINEWIYFTYPVNVESLLGKYKFPNQSLQYNYRDNSWAIFRESYTHYGQFRKQTGFTWATVGTVYPQWAAWNNPWNSGASTLLEPEVIAGNQQGFIVVRDDGTEESNSLVIQNIVGNIVTSPNHSLNVGDYIIISGVLGTIGAEVNGSIFSIGIPITANTFALDPPIVGGTYLGGGLIKRMYVPFIQSKQFPTAWGMGRKTRLGAQQYLLTTTSSAQIQLLIYLSQDADNAYNLGPIVPLPDTFNDALVYSTVLYTCPESTNLGLTPANINLNMVTALFQEQTWHRVSTSLIGDTVQIALTLSDDQMRSLVTSGTSLIITGATNANPTVLTVNNNVSIGGFLLIQGVVGMTQLNNNTYTIIARSSTTITIDVDSTAFGVYISGGTASFIIPVNQFAEIELHGIILDCSPSMVLA